MTPRVELVYFEGCPYADEARRRLRRALELTGLVPEWEEWDTQLSQTPERFRGFGSPTVLVDGRDVSGRGPGGGMRCVVGGGPSVEVIVKALQGGRDRADA